MWSYLFCLFLVLLSPRPAWAQSTDDESYDPFADYAEFDSAGDEEADIHFFRNGRFFSLGLMGGYRGFTGNLSSLYGSSSTFGLMMTYFFDLRTGLQLDFLTGDHRYTVYSPTVSADGNVTLTSFGASLKYFLWTQNMTKGLGFFNPYFMVGASQYYRTVTLAGFDTAGKDSALSANLSLGAEFPVLRNSSFIGLQGTYHMISFKDENRNIELVDASGNTVTTDQKGAGDSFSLLVILGFNY